jgi:hypothetical protein
VAFFLTIDQLCYGPSCSIPLTEPRHLPTGWSGRVWGRQGCNFDAAGRGRCATGDCGGTLYCNGAPLLRREPGGRVQHPHRHGASSSTACAPPGSPSATGRASSGAAARARRTGRRSTAARGSSAGRSSASPRPTPGCSSRRARRPHLHPRRHVLRRHVLPAPPLRNHGGVRWLVRTHAPPPFSNVPVPAFLFCFSIRMVW